MLGELIGAHMRRVEANNLELLVETPAAMLPRLDRWAVEYGQLAYQTEQAWELVTISQAGFRQVLYDEQVSLQQDCLKLPG